MSVDVRLRSTSCGNMVSVPTRARKVIRFPSWGMSSCEEETDGSFVYYTTQDADRFGVEKAIYLRFHLASIDVRDLVLRVLREHIPGLLRDEDASTCIQVGST